MTEKEIADSKIKGKEPSFPVEPEKSTLGEKNFGIVGNVLLNSDNKNSRSLYKENDVNLKLPTSVPSKTVGNFGNVDIETKVTNNTINTKVTNELIQTLSLKNKILVYFYDNVVSVQDLVDFLGEKRINIQNHLTRSSRQDGLLDQDLIKIVREEGRIKYYTCTNKGKSIVDGLIKQQESRNEIRRIESEKEDEFNRRMEIISDYLYSEEAHCLEAKRLNKAVIIDYIKLLHKNYHIILELLDSDPNELFESIKVQCDVIFGFSPNIRIKNLPDSFLLPIGEIRTRNKGYIVKIKGTPVGVTKVLPKVTKTKFECIQCNLIINILQTEMKYKKPEKCGCGGKKFRILEEDLTDLQIIKIEEGNEEMGDRTNPVTATVYLEKDLTHIDLQPHLEESKMIVVSGIVNKTQKLGKGGQSTIGDYHINANYVELEVKEDNHISEKDLIEIKKLSKKEDIKQLLVNSFASKIVNREKEKEGILLSCVSGDLSYNTNFRDDSHLLLLGDPSLGKSFLMKELRKILFKHRWVSGNTTTGVGLIGTVKKDETIGETVLSKGALPMANHSIVLCDELDKMKEDDRLALHEPLENQEVHFDKWDKHSNFKTDCTFIATMNPKYSRFTEDNIPSQINIPASLLSRFDLIFVMKDKIDNEEDGLIADAIFSRFNNNKEEDKQLIEENLLKKYLFFAKSMKPIFDNNCSKFAKEYFQKIRQQEGVGVAFSPRQQEGLLRLARANAKLRLSEKITINDLKIAINLINYSLSQIATDQITGKIDVEIVYGGMSGTERLFIDMVKKNNGKIHFENLFDQLNIPKEQFEKIIQNLQQRGDLILNKEYAIINK